MCVCVRDDTLSDDERNQPATPIETTHCNTLQHTATHCNTLHHTASHCITLQRTATQNDLSDDDINQPATPMVTGKPGLEFLRSQPTIKRAQ